MCTKWYFTVVSTEISLVDSEVNIFSYVFWPYLLSLLCNDCLCLLLIFLLGCLAFSYWYIGVFYICWIIIRCLLYVLQVSYLSLWSVSSCVCVCVFGVTEFKKFLLCLSLPIFSFIIFFLFLLLVLFKKSFSNPGTWWEFSKCWLWVGMEGGAGFYLSDAGAGQSYQGWQCHHKDEGGGGIIVVKRAL